MWSESRLVVSDSFQSYGLLHGILQARVLEWLAVPFSRGSSRPRDQTQVYHIARGFFTIWATREAHLLHKAVLFLTGRGINIYLNFFFSFFFHFQSILPPGRKDSLQWWSSEWSLSPWYLEPNAIFWRKPRVSIVLSFHPARLPCQGTCHGGEGPQPHGKLVPWSSGSRGHVADDTYFPPGVSPS